MILTDREIQIALERGNIVIDPSPSVQAFSSTSVDLTLDGNLILFAAPFGPMGEVIDPSHPDYTHQGLMDRIATKLEVPSDGYVLNPGILILAWTVEYVELPTNSRIAARVEGKSSLARLGLCVHLTAPTIHAGFQGQIQLEVINHGSRPIRLRAGMKICQLIFETTLGTPDKGYSGSFSRQAS